MPIIRIFIGILPIEGVEAEPCLHAVENEVDSELIAALHTFQMRLDVILLAPPFLGPSSDPANECYGDLSPCSAQEI